MEIKRLLILIGVIIFVSIACNMPISGRQAPAETIPISTEAVLSLEENISAAIQQAKENGKVTLVVTESQLTSYMAFEVTSQPEMPVKDVQVYLRDGQVQVYANATQDNMTAPVQMTLIANTDENGKISFEVVSAKIGPFPLPNSILNEISAEFDQAFQQTLQASGSIVYIESIVIANGTMTIQGHI